jgi:hypothetical protein
LLYGDEGGGTGNVGMVVAKSDEAALLDDDPDDRQRVLDDHFE